VTKMAEILWGPEAWCQEAYQIVTPEGSVRMCLVGAMTFISEDPPLAIDDDHPERMRLTRAIEEVHGAGALTGLDIEDWQDQSWRTWDDIAPVVARFDELTVWAGPEG
jgi:hypothetical protein